MKQRNGFVSNSSSSSFVVATSVLTRKQIDDLIEKCESPVGEYGDSWNVMEFSGMIKGFTVMRNGGDGDIAEWMRENNFPMEAVVFDND